MRAIEVERFGGPEVLRAAEREPPSPVSTEVVVDVRAAGVNPVDAKTRAGEGVAAWAGPPPFVLGWDVAGVVAETAYGVLRFAPGDRVMGMPRFPREAGGYAERVAAPSLQLTRIPDGMGFAEAAALPLAALTAWQSLVDGARIEPGARVLVVGGAGGVGHLAVQIARARGAHVLATAREEHHEWLRSLGVAEALGRDELGAARDVDVVVDLVGGEATAAAAGALAPGGVLLAIAEGASDEVRRAGEERGLRVLEPLVEPDGRVLDELAGLVARGELRVAVHEVLPLAEAARAHALLARGGLRGKLVLAVA